MIILIACGVIFGALLARLFGVFVLPIATVVASVAVAANEALITHSFVHSAAACVGVAVAVQVGYLLGQIPVLFYRPEPGHVSGQLRGHK
jgi:hypothetical protein